MQQLLRRAEVVVFSLLSTSFLLGALLALFLRSHRHFAEPRVAYGVHQLPAALVWSATVAALAGLACLALGRDGVAASLERRPVWQFLLALSAVFCLFWLPILLRFGFVQDDWMLLAAASIRTSILAHPLRSWMALDSVDGNFRPLGTVLYFGVMYRIFGLSPIPYLAGNFLINLLSVFTCFGVLREMGYRKAVAAGGGLLYLSRGLIYTESTWPSALGDSLVILFCGAAALLILRAMRGGSAAAVVYHGLAWVLFALATLSKQSSFAMPLIVAALLLLRPGLSSKPAIGRRLAEAFGAFAIYTATEFIVFHHARVLLSQQTPYPLQLTPEAVAGLFSFVPWYLVGVNVTPSHTGVIALTRLAGFVLLLLLAVVLWRSPHLLGRRPRDVLFFALAGASSLSLFLVLATRNQPYYGSLFAFWVSAGLGILLLDAAVSGAGVVEERPLSRPGIAVVCLLAALGYAEIAVKETGVIVGGGYVSGTIGMEHGRARLEQMRKLLNGVGDRDVLVLVDVPGKASYYAAMALLLDPALGRILVMDSRDRTFAANDHEGLRPTNDVAGLRDPMAYNWLVPLSAPRAGQLLAGRHAVWIRFSPDNAAIIDPLMVPEEAHAGH